jgi:hypothetical protein
VEACFGEQEIFQLELKDLARAQAVLQHEGDHGEIEEGAKAFPVLVRRWALNALIASER